MAAIAKGRERPEKILLAMYRLSEGTTRPLKYEDIVVEAFKLFPDEFALRGYPQFPDSSDIHKPLYGRLKREGFIRSGNKKFGLTATGVERAKRLERAAGSKVDRKRDGRRLTRDVEIEVGRMLGTAAVRLFSEGKQRQILDTDFYAFVGCTVRTPRNDFLGRVRTTEQAVADAVELGKPDPASAQLLNDVWNALRKDYSKLVVREEAALWGEKK